MVGIVHNYLVAVVLVFSAWCTSLIRIILMVFLVITVSWWQNWFCSSLYILDSACYLSTTELIFHVCIFSSLFTCLNPPCIGKLHVRCVQESSPLWVTCDSTWRPSMRKSNLTNALSVLKPLVSREIYSCTWLLNTSSWLKLAGVSASKGSSAFGPEC